MTKNSFTKTLLSYGFTALDKSTFVRSLGQVAEGFVLEPNKVIFSLTSDNHNWEIMTITGNYKDIFVCEKHFYFNTYCVLDKELFL